jgi:hypothetical protein
MRGTLVAAAGLGIFLAVLVAVGKATRDSLRQDERFGVVLAEIDCQPSPPMPRGEFLAEVQYLAGIPDRLSLLDEELAQRLAEIFARHPWVRRVERVEIARPRQIQVQLEYRTAALAVPVDGKLRAVDSEGVLLPVNAQTEGVPVFQGQAEPPAGPAGTRWGDPAVEQAARQRAEKP